MNQYSVMNILDLIDSVGEDEVQLTMLMEPLQGILH